MWNFWWIWRIWWVWQSGDSGKCHVSGESGNSGDLCNIYICIGYILPTIGEYTSDECIYWYLIYSSKNWRIYISWGQPAISWRASGDRQISLSASAERAFANFCDKKNIVFYNCKISQQKRRNWKFLQHLFLQLHKNRHFHGATFISDWQPCASIMSPALALAALR